MRETQNEVQLRVLHIVPGNFGYTFSGITYIANLIRYWKEADIALTLYGSDFPMVAPEEQWKLDLGGLWDKSMENTLIQRLIWNMRLLTTLVRKRGQYDILHFHVQWWGTLLSPLIAHCLGKRAIYQMSLWGSDNPSAVVSERFGDLKLRLFRKFDGVIGVSTALIDDCRKWNFSSRLLVAPSFYSINLLPPVDHGKRTHIRRRLNIPADATVLLFVGSIIRRKGIDLIIDAFIQLAARNDNLCLVLVGPQSVSENPRLDEEFVQYQKTKANAAHVGGRIRWLGLVSDPSLLSDYYQMADIFFFPTRREGQGNVILEAMIHGLPVVTTRLEGITDMMITSDSNGYLVEKEDLPGFIDAIQYLHDNPDVRRKMGSTGQERAIKQFGFDGYCERLAGFYREVAGR